MHRVSRVSGCFGFGSGAGAAAFGTGSLPGPGSAGTVAGGGLGLFLEPGDRGHGGGHGVRSPGRGKLRKIPSRSSRCCHRLGLGLGGGHGGELACLRSLLGLRLIRHVLFYITGTSLIWVEENGEADAGSFRSVMGPRSSTRCPSSVRSCMTWPTPLSMITLQMMSVPVAQLPAAQEDLLIGHMETQGKICSELST